MAEGTKAEAVYNAVEKLVALGLSKAGAFRQLADEYDQPVNSLRGLYYSYGKSKGGTSRPRRRHTTPEDAVADARATLERAIESIDREVAAAKERADEAKAEHEAMKASAAERKQAITERLEALQ